MYFKRLEIIGFKSFRDRTILEFEPGVTAIVGPNGCGKSNISDAIRWVLGEQSVKDLRGNRMEDVIFSGTQRDEPLGLAEVSLTLSNEEKLLPIGYDEVTITRRVFRSGESEYLINKIPVRLRDIVELIMGTGLGQTSYSHMAQGKIEEILSARPEERRLLFEEASGITKYRSQKKEALRKLEQTEANLLRVTDILGELERQIHSLERQVEKAKRHQEEFEKLKNLDFKITRYELCDLTEKTRNFSKEKTTSMQREETLLKERELLTEKITHFHETLEQVGSHLATLQAQKMNLVTQIQQREDRVLLHKERIGELVQKGERLRKEKGHLEGELVQLKGRIEVLQEERRKILEEMEARRKTQSFLEETLKEILHTIATSEKEIAQGKMKSIEMAQEHSKVRNELARIVTQLHTLAARSHRLLLDQEEAFEEMKGIVARREGIEKTVQEVREKTASLQETKRTLEDESHALSCHLKDLTQEVQTLRQTLIALKSRCELLEEAKRNFEGFSQGVKAMLKELEQRNPQFQKVRGVLANLLEVKPGYERAIEELLGPMVQALVVEDEETAHQGIRYLAEKGLGKASFIPLSSFREGRTTPEGGSVLEVVKASSEYAPLLSCLLGDSWIVGDIEKVSFQETLHKTYVTPKGELYRQRILTGGRATSEDLGLIGRETKIAALRKEIGETEATLVALLTQEKMTEDSRKEKEAHLTEVTEASHQWEVELSHQENSFATVQGEEKKLNEEIALIALELGEVRGELETFGAKESTLTETLHHLEEEDHLLQEELGNYHSLLSQKRLEREQTLVQLAEVKTTLASILDHREEQEESDALLEATFEEKRASFSFKEEEERLSLERMGQLSQEILELENGRSEFLQEKETVEKDLVHTAQEQEGKMTEELALQNKMNLCNSQLGHVREQLHGLELKEQEVGYEIKGKIDRLRLSYHMELSLEALGGEEPLDDLESVRAEVQKLREKLERMGPVNLVAIEEHEELKSRFSFLTSQKEDLEKAKASLLEAIQKINKVTQQLFLTTFQQIQIHFREYFRLLFGGGQAELLLLDEADVLESGIEILACPPGKKLQSVSLLSGGEKTLTVIALLFAVFKERPSPFCVLDEIDGPLDESNVARFTSVLQEFLRFSQFILVTHNKRTITMADAMYGITMEKTGVSKIVSVKFKEDEALEGRAVPA
ncbi:MAG: chromosome segregation protein SMC [Candidatus Omnitrophica bacterium]|nr:chromosome segregation protein SMC [Candidatus Omnitrophota bacterium]